MEYEKESKTGKTQKEIISGAELALNAPESIGIKEIKRPHHYFITYDQIVAMNGMPEARIILAEAVLTVATAPKSNTRIQIAKL